MATRLPFFESSSTETPADKIERLKRESKKWRSIADFLLFFLFTNAALAEHFPILLWPLGFLAIAVAVFDLLRSFYAVRKFKERIRQRRKKNNIKELERRLYAHSKLEIVRHYGRSLLNVALIVAGTFTIAEVVGQFEVPELLNINHVAWVLLIFAVFMFTFAAIKCCKVSRDLNLVKTLNASNEENVKLKRKIEEYYLLRYRKFWARLLELFCKPLMLISAELPLLLINAELPFLTWVFFGIGTLGVASVKVGFAWFSLKSHWGEQKKDSNTKEVVIEGFSGDWADAITDE